MVAHFAFRIVAPRTISGFRISRLLRSLFSGWRFLPADPHLVATRCRQRGNQVLFVSFCDHDHGSCDHDHGRCMYFPHLSHGAHPLIRIPSKDAIQIWREPTRRSGREGSSKAKCPPPRPGRHTSRKPRQWEAMLTSGKGAFIIQTDDNVIKKSIRLGRIPIGAAGMMVTKTTLLSST